MRAGLWPWLLASLMCAASLAQAAPAQTVMMPARDGVLLRNARPVDPGWHKVRIDIDGAALLFSLSELTLQAAPSECESPSGGESPSGATIVGERQGDVLRWYSVGERRQERLALMLLDERRFIAWTPSGYFTTEGTDADQAIGLWSELADGRRHFVPASEFAAHYRRPDIVRLALTHGDEAQVIAAANHEKGVAEAPPLSQLLPPVGVVVSPEEGELLKHGQATITVEIFSPSGMSLLAGAAHAADAAGDRGMVSSGGQGRAPVKLSSWKEQVVVTLPPPPLTRSTTIETTVQLNPPSLRGRMIPLHLRWENGWRVSLPNLFALTVGINEYQQAADLPTLRFAEKDARDVADALRGQEGLRYRRVFAQSLTTQQATLAELRTKLGWLQRQPQERDVVMLFLAGHGIGRGEGQAQRYFFLTADADPDKLEKTALSDDELFRTLARVRAHSVVLFIDTCHAGATPAQRRLLEELQAQSGVVVYSATKANRPSQERQRWSNGAFSRALVEGFHGGADLKGSGRITASGLEHFVSARVKELTSGEQEPTTLKAATDLWLGQSVPLRVYKRWWFWTAIGVAAAGAAGAIIGATYRPPPPFPSGIEVLTIN